MAQVWLVHDQELDEEVVAKIVPPGTSDDLVALLRRECRNARRLVHPHIARVFDFHRGDKGHHFLTMSHVEGEDIGCFRGRPPAEILSLALPIADALAHSHRMGVVHRDLKVSNVLLDADRQPQLVDFGIAGVLREEAEGPENAKQTSGEQRAPIGGGSQYNVSPQQLGGQEAQPADDIYAFGVLLYELITGHPPFWPEPTPQRIQSERPGPMRSAHPLPSRLQALVASMLEKSPAKRPAGMEAVKTELESLQKEIEAENKAVREAVHLTPPPRVQAIKPISPRADSAVAGAGASTAAIVGEKIRAVEAKRWSRSKLVFLSILGLVVIQAFFFLPDWLARPRGGEAGKSVPAPAPPQSAASPAQVSAGASLPGAERPPFQKELREQAYLEQQADEVLHQAMSLKRALERKGVSVWGAEDYALAQSQMAAGAARLKAGKYAAADTAYRAALRLLKGVDARAAGVAEQALASGRKALEAGESTAAAAAFRLAAQIAPGDPAALGGLRSAEHLDEVRALLEAGAQSERQGDRLGAQRAYGRALALDPESRPARGGLARVRSQIRHHSFAGFMSAGLAALDRADYAAAREAFERAEKLQPRSPLVADALARLDEAEKLDKIDVRRERAARLEAAEKWRAAAAQYDLVLKLDPTIVFAQEGKARALKRAELAERIEFHLEHPQRLSSDVVFAEASELMKEAAGIEPAGPRHRRQVKQLERLLETMGQTVRVVLESDDETEVTVYRVGALGSFVRRELELRPGTYTVVGQRQGYRDVRVQLVVKPGQKPAPLPVRCEEEI